MNEERERKRLMRRIDKLEDKFSIPEQLDIMEEYLSEVQVRFSIIYDMMMRLNGALDTLSRNEMQRFVKALTDYRRLMGGAAS